jgi:hypothetical protein
MIYASVTIGKTVLLAERFFSSKKDFRNTAPQSSASTTTPACGSSSALTDLLWMNDGVPGTRPPRWRAPSWSWASVSRCLPTGPDWIQLDPLHVYAKLENTQVKLVGSDPHGEVRDAYIRILRPMVLDFLQKLTIS